MIDTQILERLQYALLEAPDGGVNWPSGLWNRDEVLAFLNQRQSAFLKNALLIVKVSASLAVAGAVTQGGVLVGQTRVNLPTDLIRLVSVVWIPNTGAARELMRSDSFEVDHLVPAWETPANYPLVYMEYETPTLQVQIAPSPTAPGSLVVLYVAKGTTLTGTGTALTVPDEFGHALQYGVLADLLSKDGRGHDLARATYASQRFDLAVTLAQIILKGWA